MRVLAKAMFFILVALTLSTGCSANMVTSKKIEKLISENLEPGDPFDTIEEFLRGQNLSFTYDRFSSRYSSIIRDPAWYKPKGYHSIVIHIYVDENKAFQRAEVRDSYTLI